jgi:hypothetical protein
MTHALLSRKGKDATASGVKTAPETASMGLRLGEPHDAFEQEADRVADELMTNGTAGAKWSLSKVSIGTGLQRKCACGGSGECDECKKDEKAIQRRSDGRGEAVVVPPLVHDVLRAPGEPLDAPTLRFFEPRFGQDFSRVRVHADSKAAQSARAVHARAYTFRREITFAPGEYNPATSEGRELIAHELAHVVQQGNDPSLRTRTAHSVGRTDDPAEIEAERIGAQVVGESRAGVEREAPSPQRVIAARGVLVESVGPATIQRQSADDPFGFGPKKISNYESAGMIAAGGTPLKKSVEGSHFNSEAEKQEFIRDYIRYAKEHGLTKQYQDAIAAYPDFDPDKPAAPPPAVTQYAQSVAQSQPASTPKAPARKPPPAIAKLPYRERPVASVQFKRLGFLGMEGLITVTPNEPWIQKGPDPTAGYNFDVYLVNMEGGPPVPAQWLGGTRYRVLMGTPECPGCHFGHGLEIDLMGEHPLFIAGTMALQMAPIAADLAAARVTVTQEEALVVQGKGAAANPGAPVATADGTGTVTVETAGERPPATQAVGGGPQPPGPRVGEGGGGGGARPPGGQGGGGGGRAPGAPPQARPAEPVTATGRGGAGGGGNRAASARALAERDAEQNQGRAAVARGGFWRGKPVIQDGNANEGWAHIDARHVTGNAPEGAGDLFARGTTRAQLQNAAEEIADRGVRISDPNRRLQTFERRITINGQSDTVRVVVDTADGRVITMFPVRGGG